MRGWIKSSCLREHTAGLKSTTRSTISVGVNPHRTEQLWTSFAPSIMTPIVRMGFSPSAVFRIIAVGVNPHRTEQLLLASLPVSSPPPYGWALVHPFLRSETWRSKSSHGQETGENGEGGNKYCSLRSQHHVHHRTDGPWSIRWFSNHRGGSKPPPYGASAARFAPSIMTSIVRMGLGPSAKSGLSGMKEMET